MSGGRYPPGSVEILDPESPSLLYGGPRYPGHGFRPRPGEDRPALSAWGRLSRGGALGKTANMVFRAGQEGLQVSRVPIMEIMGDDADAQQVLVTLASPRVIPLSFSDTLVQLAPQNASGEQNNAQIQSRATFPGEIVPIEWPPLMAILEWGTGGTQAQATIDFLNGQTVSLICSFLRITPAAVNGFGVSGTSALYTLSAFVGPGFGRTNAHRTVYVGDVAADAESAVFAIPSFAKHATVIGMDDGDPPEETTATLRFWQSPNRTHNVGNFEISGAVPGAFPIPAAAAYATVINGMADQARMAILYTLAI